MYVYIFQYYYHLITVYLLLFFPFNNTQKMPRRWNEIGVAISGRQKLSEYYTLFGSMVTFETTWFENAFKTLKRILLQRNSLEIRSILSTFHIYFDTFGFERFVKQLDPSWHSHPNVWK